MLRNTFVAVVTFFATAAAAHPGHGATPVHVHIAGIPVDVGAIALLLVVGCALVGRWAARAQR